MKNKERGKLVTNTNEQYGSINVCTCCMFQNKGGPLRDCGDPQDCFYSAIIGIDEELE